MTETELHQRAAELLMEQQVIYKIDQFHADRVIQIIRELGVIDRQLLAVPATEPAPAHATD